MLRLSPVVFRTHSGDFIRDNLAAELSDNPHEVNGRKTPWRPHAEDEIIEGPWWPGPGLRWNSWVWSVCERNDHPPISWVTAFEEFCGENNSNVLSRLWAVTASRDAQRASAFYFAPKVVVEGENNIHALTVLGIGGLPEAAGLVLVVMVVKKLKGGSSSAYDLLMPLILNYDPDLDMFRVINFDDFSLWMLRDVP